MIEESPTPRSVYIFGYSMILPAAWISISLVFGLLAPGLRLGTVGTALMFIGVAALIGWIFAKRHRRQFTNREYWRMILYCFLWAVSLEFFVLLTVVVLPQLEAGQLNIKTLALVAVVTIVVDALFAWLAFRQSGRKVIDSYLRGSNGTRGA